MATITQNENSWEISGDILMENVSQLLEKSKNLVLSDSVVVDFKQVLDLDTSAVSLMLEWQRRAIAENKQLTFVNLSANLKSLIDLYGVEALIN